MREAPAARNAGGAEGPLARRGGAAGTIRPRGAFFDGESGAVLPGVLRNRSGRRAALGRDGAAGRVSATHGGPRGGALSAGHRGRRGCVAHARLAPSRHQAREHPAAGGRTRRAGGFRPAEGRRHGRRAVGRGDGTGVAIGGGRPRGWRGHAGGGIRRRSSSRAAEPRRRRTSTPWGCWRRSVLEAIRRARGRRSSGGRRRHCPDSVMRA